MSIADFPYPMLRSVGNDYREDCSFGIEFIEDRQKIEGDEIILSVDYCLSCSSLEEMIHSKKAEACLLVRSPAASFGRTYPFETDSHCIKARLNKFEVIDKLELQCAIIAKEDDTRFESNDFNPLFFKDDIFHIEKGAILAESEKIILPLDDSELEKPLESIFKIQKCAYQSEDIEVNINDSIGKILINLRGDLYDLYSKIDKGYARTLRRCLAGIVAYPALVKAIEALSRDYDEYADYRWARAITKKTGQLGIDIENIVCSVEVADKLLGNVVADSLMGLKSIIDGYSDEDGWMGTD